MKTNLVLISTVAEMLGVPAHRIAYAYMSKKLPEPEMRLGNRRIFSAEDIRRLRNHFNNKGET